jgi:hypothetical protein
MRRLDENFNRHTKDVRVHIMVPDSEPVTLSVQDGTFDDQRGRLTYPDHRVTSSSTIFKLIGELMWYLDQMTSLSRLTVVLINEHATPAVELTHAQLYLALPFYALSFKDWKLMVVGGYLSSLKPLVGIYKHLLNLENGRMIRDQERAAKAQMRQAQPPPLPSYTLKYQLKKR